MRSRLLQLLFRPLQSFGISASIQSTALWTMLESFSSAFFSLMLIPILTHNLGLEKYGLYVMVTAFVSFFSFAGLGMNTSITYYLAVNHQAANTKNIAERLGSALSLTLIGTVTFSCACLLVLSLYVSQLQALYPQLSEHQNLVYAALMLIVITQLDLVVSAALKGLQQFKTSSKIEFTIRLLGFLVIAMVAITQKNVTAIIVATIITAFSSLIIRYRTLSKVIALHLSDIKLTRHYVSELFHFGKWMTLQNIAGALFGSLDKLIVGSLLGNKVVGIYNVLLSITQLIHYVPANILTFILPKVAKNPEALTISLLKKIFTITTLVSSIIAVLIFMFKQVIFLKFHIDSHYGVLFNWLIISYVLLSLNIPSFFIALGMNLIRAVSAQCIIGSVLGILSLLVTVSKYGVLSAATSKLIYSSVAIFLVIPVLKRMRLNKL
jgi:O-antigen/teichoic acid export membrane protein